MKYLYQQNITWTGNVRALKTLLSLAISQVRRTKSPMVRVLRDILDRGPESHNWVGIYTATQASRSEAQPDSISATALTTDLLVNQVLSLDENHDCYGPGPDWPHTGSELMADELLKKMSQPVNAEKEFARLLLNSNCRQSRNIVRRPVRLSRIFCYLGLAKDKLLTRRLGHELCEVGPTTVQQDCKLLADHCFLVGERDKNNRTIGWRLPAK